MVNWENDGEEVRSNIDQATGRVRSHNYNGDYAFRSGFTWTGMTSSAFAVRIVQSGYMFDAKGPMGFPRESKLSLRIVAFLNSTVATFLMKILSPTLDYKLGHVLSLPFWSDIPPSVEALAEGCIEETTADWDSSELSWDFQRNPLQCEQNTLKLRSRYDSCLLYTSPSPRDRQKSRMPSSA